MKRDEWFRWCLVMSGFSFVIGITPMAIVADRLERRLEAQNDLAIRLEHRDQDVRALETKLKDMAMRYVEKCNEIEELQESIVPASALNVGEGALLYYCDQGQSWKNLTTSTTDCVLTPYTPHNSLSTEPRQ